MGVAVAFFSDRRSNKESQVNHARSNLKQAGHFSVWLGVMAGVLLVFGSLFAARAFAAYEQVGIFAGSLTPPVKPGVFPEEVQLGGVSGMAVNVTGAGGVAPGTVYAMTKEVNDRVVARFEPESDGKLKFVEAWEVVESNEVLYRRCGPLLGTVCGTQQEGSQAAIDVDVDQVTGNVYVYRLRTEPSEGFAITEYSPDGSKVIAQFGEVAVAGESTAASPEKIHESKYPGAIAVDGSGDVYLYDENVKDDFYHRLMEFRPQTPGDYEHYVYAGTSHDVGAGFYGEGNLPIGPVMDSAGHIYVAGEGWVEEYDPGSSPGPVCAFVEPKYGITAMTVDAASGEVFFYSYKDKRVHRLSACDGEGKFVELEAFAVSPERGELTALAFDPSRRFVSLRAPGVLYGGAAEPVPTIGKGEPGQSSLGYIFAPVLENPPVVESEAVSGVTESSAELHAMVDPRGSLTRYVFQYVTEAAFLEDGESFGGAVQEAPVGGAVLGNDQGAIGAAVTVTGLLPDTAYRYRVVASSRCSGGEPEKVCEGAGVAEGFRTFPVGVGGLPDGRAYELVSPIDKNGGQVFPAEPLVSSCTTECKPGGIRSHFPMQSAPDGEAVVYEGAAFSAGGGELENEYLSRRSPSGWQTTSLTPPLYQRSHAVDGYMAFDPGLTTGLFDQSTPSLSPEAPSEFRNLYEQSTSEPSVLRPLVVGEPPNRLPGTRPGDFEVEYAGASADLSRVFFAANDALTAEAVGGSEGKTNLYEWSGGVLRSVNLLPGSTETTPGAVYGASGDSDVASAVSSDGSRVFWSSQTGQVYVREDGEQTVEIPDHTGRFLTASRDGSRVLLSDGMVFRAGGGGVYELQEDLSRGQGGFQGIVGQSEDLSHVYFVDTKTLTGENIEHRVPNEHGGAEDNLYAWDEGTVVFVATLLPQDNAVGQDNHVGGDWLSSPGFRVAQASPDGDWVAFLSIARLTGYDNIGPCEKINGTDQFAQAPCDEAFLYDSATGELRCVSCDRSGAAPLGRTVLPRIEEGRSQPSYLMDSGRLFFDSEDSLVPGDINHGVEDVYEFEPEGIGTCAHRDGCVFLISAGTGSVDSNFLAADPSGANVFFTTRDRLVSSDKDELIDLYDARERGGFAGESERTPGGCEGEACQGSQSSSPLLEPGVLGSFAFSGAGNLTVSPPPPSSSLPGTPVTKARVLTRAQKLTRALRACRAKKRRGGRQRAVCERAAHAKYGARASAKRSAVTNGGKGHGGGR
jgi:hypothetical protein